MMKQKPEVLLADTNLEINCQTSESVSLVGLLTEASLWHRDVFMEVFHAALLREVSHSVAFSTHNPFGGQKPLQTHWTSGVYPCCANTNFSSCKYKKKKINFLSNFHLSIRINFNKYELTVIMIYTIHT